MTNNLKHKSDNLTDDYGQKLEMKNLQFYENYLTNSDLNSYVKQQVNWHTVSATCNWLKVNVFFYYTCRIAKQSKKMYYRNYMKDYSHLLLRTFLCWSITDVSASSFLNMSNASCLAWESSMD